MGVEGVQNSGLILGGSLETVRGGEPLLDFSLLSGGVGLGCEGGHFGDLAEGLGEGGGGETPDCGAQDGEYCCGVLGSWSPVY